MAKNKLVAPVVKWVGGKRQLLDEITPLLPKRITNYCEPFLGGGAVLFSIQPSKAIVNDLNVDLITVYEVIRDDVEALIESLKKHENTSEYFYALRDIDRDKVSYQSLSKVERASRLIYLNKTCFNGLFRVNSSGEFNSPFGHYKNPNIVNEPVLRAVSKYFNASNIAFYSEDFAETLLRVHKGGFVYLDPPYFKKGNQLYMNFLRLEDHVRIETAIKEYASKYEDYYNELSDLDYKIRNIDYQIYKLKNNEK